MNRNAVLKTVAAAGCVLLFASSPRIAPTYPISALFGDTLRLTADQRRNLERSFKHVPYFMRRRLRIAIVRGNAVLVDPGTQRPPKSVPFEYELWSLPDQNHCLQYNPVSNEISTSAFCSRRSYVVP